MGLDDELRGLERRWLERGAPVSELFQPGLDPDEVTRALDAIGGAHPDVVTWYGWHNGSSWEPRDVPAVPSGRTLTPLPFALEYRQVLLDIEAERVAFGAGTDDDVYSPMWLPVATTIDAQGYAIVVDLGTGEVYRHDNGPGSLVYEMANLRIADDLASLVRIWCDELARGTYVWDPASYAWQYDPADQPADLRERYIIH